MNAAPPTDHDLSAEVARLRARVAELEQALAAVQPGEAPMGQAQAAQLDSLLTNAPVDITAQRQLERALQAEHQQLAAILETLEEGVMAFQPDGTLITLNSAVRRHLGWPADAAPTSLDDFRDAIQHRIYDSDGRLVPDEQQPVLRALRGEPFQDIPLRFVRESDGQEGWFLFTSAPVHAADGQIELVVVTARDITVEKQADKALRDNATALSRSNAELVRALRLKDEFLAMMSHELRTPLNAVLGITESIQEELYGPVSERQQQALERVIQSGRHLLGILSGILDLTRIEAGTIHMERAPVHVERLCQTALQLVAERARKKELRLIQTVAFGVVGVRGDERRLIQILVNLLDNAVKFTPDKGTVGLEVEGDAAQEQITFVVWDTGIGIAPEDMERLFRPFTQVDGRLSRSYEGIGLGLTLVQRLAELHGGSVQVASIPRMGSRFTVTLPWMEDDNIRPRELGPASAGAQLVWARPPRVLVAEDHEPTLELYTAQLARQGCTVLTARTGSEALAQIQRQRPDIVLLDIQMPELDGLSVIRKVRADATLSALPIIAVTALAMPGDRERVLAAGATRYLAKPVGGHTLLSTITEVLAG